jgi:KAP family P-loop domain
MAGRGTPLRGGGDKAPFDGLRHQEVADAVAGHVAVLPPGSVISVQGSWGRGKTDVLARVFDRFAAAAEGGDRPEPLWLDPWQYGTPDLIRPVVVELLARMPPEQQRSRRLRLAARTLLRAGNAMMFKALTVVAPFGDVIEAAKPAVDEMIDDLLEPGGDTAEDADPVAAMAERFRELVAELLAGTGRDGPLLVCVDDLDRCLPDHQIAMLEAVHFLTSAGARCSFLIALDPVLVQQAAVTHYRTDGFDANQYLDKLFDLRVNLAALQPSSIEALLDGELRRPVVHAQAGGPTTAEVLRDGLEVGPDQVRAAFRRAFCVPELTNPRLVHRVFERLRLAATANAAASASELRGPDRLDALVVWCAVAERWPQLRQILQASPDGNWAVNLRGICGFYGLWDDGGFPAAGVSDHSLELARVSSLTSRLPGRDRQPDLGSFVEDRILGRPELLAVLRQIDNALVAFGL